MKTQTVKIGKYKGLQYNEVPANYAQWQYRNGNKKFYNEWLMQMRFSKHDSFTSHSSSDGRYMERRLEDGSYVFFITPLDPKILHVPRTYYLVDSNGNYLRDLKTFGSVECKQGCIDTAIEGWVTLTPNGTLHTGKLLVSPYNMLGFEYLTYRKEGYFEEEYDEVDPKKLALANTND